MPIAKPCKKHDFSTGETLQKSICKVVALPLLPASCSGRVCAYLPDMSAREGRPHALLLQACLVSLYLSPRAVAGVSAWTSSSCLSPSLATTFCMCTLTSCPGACGWSRPSRLPLPRWWRATSLHLCYATWGCLTCSSLTATQ